MVLPLSDSPNPRGVPFITYALIAANVAVYVLIALPLSATPADPRDPALQGYIQIISEHLPQHMRLDEVLQNISEYNLYVFRHGFRPAAPQLSALFFSLFLHEGFLHLFGNMLFLWIYGDNVEYRLGPMRYLIAYLGTGIGATLFHTVFFPDSPLPLIGASGAISGVLGFYFVWFPHNQVRLLVLIVPFFMRVVSVSARWVLGFFLLIDNVLPFVLTLGSDGTGVAFGAHIGGFVLGLAIAKWMDRGDLGAPTPAYERGSIAFPATGSPKEMIQQALTAGHERDAADIYFGLEPQSTRRLLTADESLQLADWLRGHRHSKPALAVYRRHLRDYPDDPSAAAAHLGAGLVQLEDLGQPTPAYQHFLDALQADPSPEVAARARAALATIAARQKLQVGRGS